MTMSGSVVGIDFGSQSCRLTSYCLNYAGNQPNANTIANDHGLQTTPSFVAFSPNLIEVGVAAKDYLLDNVENTIFNFKRYIGRHYYDPCVQENISKSASIKIVPSDSDQIGFEVMSYGSDLVVYTPTQITSFLFSKLKKIAEGGVEGKINGYVISVPTYFNEPERRSLLLAAQLADMNVLQLLDETDASAFSYGIEIDKQKLLSPQEGVYRNAIIVDFGHSALQVSAVAFSKSELKTLAYVADPSLGGQNFDSALAAHFSSEFRFMFNIDPESSPKAYIHLLTEVEKLKKEMSESTTNLNLNMTNFMGKDVTRFDISRVDFEEMCASLFKRTEIVLRRCLLDSQLDLNDIHCVEMIGGSTKIPGIQSLIEKVFQKSPSATLDWEDAVSRGCALHGARQLGINASLFDHSSLGSRVKLTWHESSGFYTDTNVFPRLHNLDKLGLSTFKVEEPVKMECFPEETQFEVENGAKEENVSDLVLGSQMKMEVQPLRGQEREQEIIACINASEKLKTSLKTAMDTVQNYYFNEAEFAHVTEKDIDSAILVIEDSSNWLQDCEEKFSEMYRQHKPLLPVSSSEIVEQRLLLERQLRTLILYAEPEPEGEKDEPSRKKFKGADE